MARALKIPHKRIRGFFSMVLGCPVSNRSQITGLDAAIMLGELGDVDDAGNWAYSPEKAEPYLGRFPAWEID
jgi:hypothetical protein